MTSILGAGERRVLRAVCDTLLPALAAEDGDNPALFSLDAIGLGVDRFMEEAFEVAGPARLSELRFLLRLLETRLLPLLLTRSLRPFPDLARGDRGRVLLAMSTSRVARFRTGFQALKRLACFLFYTLRSEGDRGAPNPAWAAIGYAPTSNPPAAPAPLRLTTITANATLECDVCVIGSGAGGGVVAAQMAAAGRRVIVLEAGNADQAPDHDQHELTGMRRLYLEQGLTATRDLGIAILAGAGLGGGTTVNWQTSLRTPDSVRDEWAERSGCRHFAEESFTCSLDSVAERLAVGTAESVVNANNAVLQRGSSALGFRCGINARNSRGCDSAQCGYCVFGCRVGGKQSTVNTYLADAQRAGDTMIIPRCRAETLVIHSGSRRVTGVIATARDEAQTAGAEWAVEVRAPVVVVAAGAIESPLLLLRSGVELPAIGRNLFLHPTAAVAGRYQNAIEPWRGPPQTVLCDHFSAGPDGDGYGFRCEAAPAHPGLLALGLPWLGDRDHRRRMQQVARTSALIVLTRDREGETGRVRLARDGRADITYRPGASVRSLLRDGMVAAVRLHAAAGAMEVMTLDSRGRVLGGATAPSPGDVDAFCDRISPDRIGRNWSTLFSAHQMGTCRMGADPRAAVCNGDGAVFGVGGLFIADASAFPLSSGVNPMITIMAMAHHSAGRILAG
ncbi:MAG: GMC family oxidoreductase N-terminal domain-containing protein [Gemmatimonadaceae bacterium]